MVGVGVLDAEKEFSLFPLEFASFGDSRYMSVVWKSPNEANSGSCCSHSLRRGRVHRPPPTKRAIPLRNAESRRHEGEQWLEAINERGIEPRNRPSYRKRQIVKARYVDNDETGFAYNYQWRHGGGELKAFRTTLDQFIFVCTNLIICEFVWSYWQPTQTTGWCEKTNLWSSIFYCRDAHVSMCYFFKCLQAESFEAGGGI